MTSPRIVDTLATLLPVQQCPALRTRYASTGALGIAIAETVECHLAIIEDADNEPTPGDERLMLERIASDPAAASVACIEAVEHRLLPPCVRRYRTQDIDGLSPEQLAQCARDALETMPQGQRGRPRRALAHQHMLARLLSLVPDWTREQQDELMVRALAECKTPGAFDWLLGQRDSRTVREYLRAAQSRHQLIAADR